MLSTEYVNKAGNSVSRMLFFMRSAGILGGHFGMSIFGTVTVGNHS